MSPAHLPSPLLLPIPVIQLQQVLTVALGAPGATGVIATVEARLQGRRGPRIRQPYYDLAKRRADRDVRGVSLVRVEQLYPFPADQLRQELNGLDQAEVWWVQEEPENMGAWYYLRRVCRDRLGLDLRGLTREESASPAAGSLAVHQAEQAGLLDAAFEGL